MFASSRARRASRRVIAVVCALLAAASIFTSITSTRSERFATPPALAAPGTAPVPPPETKKAPRVVEGSKASASGSGAAIAPSSDPLALSTPSGTAVYAYPPLSATSDPAPVVVMLHGMCSDPRGTCQYWSAGGRHDSWLVCPQGNGACGDRPDWSGSGEEKARFLDGVLATVKKETAARVAADDTVIAGFSRGAYVARDVVYARPGRFRAAILLGAAADPDPARFKAAGIRRVVLGAGYFDGARLSMQRSAERLRAAGLPARYVDLGKIGHQLPDDLERVMTEALRWAKEPSSE